MQLEPNHLQIQFSQWRAGEYVISSFYVASDEPLDDDPLPDTPTRDIVDGDIIIDDLTERVTPERMSLIDYLPRAISTFGKVIGGIFSSAIALGLIVFVIWSWKNSIVLFNWKRRYLSNFIDYLDKIGTQVPEHAKQRFRKKPYYLPNRLWDKFEGQRAPSSSMVFDSVGEVIIFTIVPLMLAFGTICVILVLLPA